MDTTGEVESQEGYQSSYQISKKMTAEQRRKKRQARKSHGVPGGQATNERENSLASEERFSALLACNEDELLEFVAKVNKVYQELLKKPAPFMNFVFCGMQSTGKSSIMERFLNAVLNIVQEGTGTRCPLDATCIHDSKCLEPTCELAGEELPEDQKGEGLNVSEVFERITQHNKKLGDEDRFSTQPLYLVYRSSNVQNMRFVDTPGIISNKLSGKDNREEIKTILRSELRKPNTKLCVLMEPKEFATNSIIDFCDDTFGGRQKWIGDATFLMTKFDKQLHDSRTSGKANLFFKEFFDNQCHPHLVITPTLQKENLPFDKLFEARSRLIAEADGYEKDKFDAWKEGHERFRMEEDDGDELLHNEIQKRIGFASAKRIMREIMLKDTVDRLPEVLASLKEDLERCLAEEKTLKERKKFTDAQNLRAVVQRMLFKIQERILSYLDGDLEVTMKFEDKLMTLEEEIEEEEESDWKTRELNFHSEKEDHWRDRIANLEHDPEDIHAEDKFLGGKQYHRAIEFFRIVMIDSLPDPFQLKDKVANVTGFLSDGLQQENWERAMVEIIRVSLKDVSHPGMNYLVKHVGCIFRRLFGIALEDIKQGEENSAEFKLVPPGVVRFLTDEFDESLWSLLVAGSEEAHSAVETTYSSIDPSLPTFHPSKMEESRKEYFVKSGDKFISAKEHEDETETTTFLSSWKTRIGALLAGSGFEAKKYLMEENRKRATAKRSFLPDERTSMVTNEEIDMILQRAFEYIVALLEFNLYVFRFQLNHHIYKGFKDMIRSTYMTKVNDADWDNLVQKDPSIDHRLAELTSQIKGLSDSLRDVQRMQRTI